MTFYQGKLECCIFRPVFGCCPPQTLVEIFIFSTFCAKKLKNAKIIKSAANLAKKLFLKFYQNAGFSKNKTLDQHFGANLKKTIFFAKFYTKFVTGCAFFQLLSTKNTENYYFDQRLGCAALKHCSKYTTLEYWITLIL